MTTPADQMRTAAARLRELANTASTDPYGRDTSTWTSHHVNDHDARLYGPDRVRIIRGGSSGPHGRGTHPHLAPAHADYIAALHPGVGKALADLLVAVANDPDDETLNNPGSARHGGCDRTVCPAAAALAVARALLGGGQP
ncbi:hypothetical protein OG352_06160 [Streptomyces sp. NBC_01485]|uniref:hypothetical protein n=1 Tax=Streptomyces sp. NBC_01485 TaxID=2903884 RepID=UPI002E320112|nr:hypothetical protein [Streptomyces sp. NBC_01485]